ncbi:cell division protein FtsZ, partial [Ameyamaea chiangmaiensis]|nr:cell division protein FtsZ [Ameyamaea chiangmaiensis]
EPQPSRSLFGIVTGAFRGRPPAEATPAPQRNEPEIHPHEPPAPGVSVQEGGADEIGLDIPAFLRRQSN